jgi:hypothetical protein
MSLPTTPTAALNAVPPEDLGKASGTQNTLFRFGSVFAVAVASAVFAGSGHLGSAASFTDGFRPALAVVAGLSLLGAVTGLAVGARRRPALEVRREPVATAA